MLSCEGYKMFYGKANVTLKGSKTPLKGTWLWNPETEMWYINRCEKFPWGTSFDKIYDIEELPYGE